MERKVGTISRGIRCPIIREGDNLADIIVSSVLEAAFREVLGIDIDEANNEQTPTQEGTEE